MRERERERKRERERERERSCFYLKVKRVPMSNWDRSSALDLGKDRRYRSVSNAGTTRAFLVLAMSNCTTDFLRGGTREGALNTLTQNLLEILFESLFFQ